MPQQVDKKLMTKAVKLASITGFGDDIDRVQRIYRRLLAAGRSISTGESYIHVERLPTRILRIYESALVNLNILRRVVNNSLGMPFLYVVPRSKYNEALKRYHVARSLQEDTPGLSLGYYKLDTVAGTIEVTIKDTQYVYKPIDGVDLYDLYRSVTGMAKYSTGKSLTYLKRHAVGVRAEGIHGNRRKTLVIMDDKKSFTSYSDLSQAVSTSYPGAQSVKDDRNGLVIYVEPDSNKVVASWSATKGKGFMVSETSDVEIDDFDKWLDTVKGADDVEFDKLGDVELLTAKDKSGKSLGTYARGKDGKAGAGKTNSTSTGL